jgi:hypothetical protein
MKKMFMLLILFLSIAVGSNVALANGDYYSHFGYGAFDINASSIGGGIDFDKTHTPHYWEAGAFGISGAGGLARSSADGFIINGMVEGEVTTIGGGLTGTNAEKGFYNVPFGKGLYVGSSSLNRAVTGGSIRVKVDPDGKLIFGFIPTAGGAASGEMSGIAGQGSLNASGMGDGPVLRNDGFTGGIAGQGSIGMFSGGVFAVSGPDYKDYRNPVYSGGEDGGAGYYLKVKGHRTGRVKYFRNGHPDDPSEWVFLGANKEYPEIDSKAGAGVGAEIDMVGGSSSYSWREFSDHNGVRTEAMGTNVSAFTQITSYGYNYDWDKGLGCSYSYLQGGWVAGGGVASMTKIGGARSSAVGYYMGSGNLNNNFDGQAIGYTNGSVTTVQGMNGSITQAGAGMSVTSNVTYNHGQID